MQTLQLTDPVYERIQQRASAWGMTVEAYIDAIAEAEAQQDELTKPLTPELKAKVEASRMQIKNGQGKTIEQVRAELRLNIEHDEPNHVPAAQLAIAEAAHREIRAGKLFTPEQVSEKLAANREAWAASHQ